jgi:hypothetical protein
MQNLEGWFTEPHNNLNRLDYLSHSKLSKLKQSPAHFESKYLLNEPDKAETPSLRLGKLIEAAVLNPKEFRKRVRVEPDAKKNTKAGKEEYQIFQESLEPDAIVVDSDEFTKILGCIRKLEKDVLAQKYLWANGLEYKMNGYVKKDGH